MYVHEFLEGYEGIDKQQCCQYIKFWDSSGGVGKGLNTLSAFWLVVNN